MNERMQHPWLRKPRFSEVNVPLSEMPARAAEAEARNSCPWRWLAKDFDVPYGVALLYGEVVGEVLSDEFVKFGDTELPEVAEMLGTWHMQAVAFLVTERQDIWPAFHAACVELSRKLRGWNQTLPLAQKE